MRLKSLDIFLALGVAVANVAWALFTLSAGQTPVSLISIILALPMVLLVPGYLLSETLLPPGSLETVQRLVFSLALSLSVTILGGFALNQLPTGLHTLPWAIWLGSLTTIFALLAYLRRMLQPATPRAQVRPQRRRRVQIAPFLLLGMAALVAVLAVAYSVIGAEQRPYLGKTQIWVLPATEAGNTCAVSIGMQSFELATTEYHVVVYTNKTQTATWSPVSLVPQQQWAQLLPIAAGSDTSLVVHVQLYRLDQPQKQYQHVDLVLHVAGTAGAKHCSISSVFPSYRPIAGWYL